MIYGRSIYNRIMAFLLITAGLVLIALSLLGISEYRKSETKMKGDILLLLEQAISEEVRLKMEDIYVSVHMESNPSVLKEKVKKQTIITNDTTFAKEAEVSENMDMELLKGFQSYLLHVNRLQPDTLQRLFNVKLDENGIKACSYILVHHEYDSEMSGDTTGYPINYRIPVIKGGVFGEIAYEGLLHYSPFTVFRLMSKSMLIVLFTLEVLMLGVIIYLFVEKRKIKPDKIMKRGRYYYIGETIFDTRKNELIGQRREVIPVTRKPAEMLLMFLKSDDHVVEKSVLKETLWPDKPYTTNHSLMSTINLVRNYLKDVGCAFSIITKKGDDYYILKYMQKDTEPDILTLIFSVSPSSPSAAEGK
jgi:DNA-binding winged helix-turn-helix (wHTH) protein